MTAATPIEKRKLDHIDINLHEDVQSHGLSTGFERIQFVSNALPELDLNRVDVSATFLGRKLEAPLLISSMTGGVERGWNITRRLAVAAQQLGCALGVGSQRAALERSELDRFFAVRSEAPDVLLFANLGAVQLNHGYTVEHCRRAVDMISADALFLHLNPLQEALQDGGNTDWRDLQRKIERLCAGLSVPVVAKEVGFGISVEVARRLVNCGVAAIDVSGAGGTSWSKVEHLRCTDARQREVSRAFLGWGIPTARCLVDLHDELADVPLIASGGIRTGEDAAKAFALGAGLVGIAGPLFRAAAQGQDQAIDALQAIVEELRITMFAVGAGSIEQLKTAQLFELDAPILSREKGGSS